MITAELILDACDADELAELLEFLTDWLVSDGDRLEESLNRFVDNAGYDLHQLRGNVDRFTFLRAGNDGESLFEHRRSR